MYTFLHRTLLALPIIVVVVMYSQTVLADSVAQFKQTILPPSQSIGFVDESGTINDVAELTLPISTTELRPRFINAVLGTSQQKIQIINPALDKTWSVTVAVTDGPTALWRGSAGSYAYNDPNDKGQLTIDPSQAQIEAIPDATTCPINGLFLGSKSAFSSGQEHIDNITILNGTALYSAYCAWNITGIQIEQLVPAGQPAGRYNLPLTLTII